MDSGLYSIGKSVVLQSDLQTLHQVYVVYFHLKNENHPAALSRNMVK